MTIEINILDLIFWLVWVPIGFIGALARILKDSREYSHVKNLSWFYKTGLVLMFSMCGFWIWKDLIVDEIENG